MNTVIATQDEFERRCIFSLDTSDLNSMVTNNPLQNPRPNDAVKEPLTAADFEKAIREGKAIDCNGRKVSGRVDLTGLTIENSLTIRDTVFDDEVDLSQIRFKRGFELSDCHFAKSLILSSARVEGPLKLQNVIIGDEQTQFEEIEALRLQVGLLERGTSQARFFLDLPGIDSNARRRKESLLLLRSRLEAAEIKQSELTAGAQFDNLRVEGSLLMETVKVCGTFSCNHAEVQSDLSLDRVLVFGDFSLRHSRIGELLNKSTASPAETCRIGGVLDLTSATVSGDVFLVGMTIGRLTLQAAEINGNLVYRSDPHRRARIRKGAWLLAARVKGDVDFSGVRMHGDLILDVASMGNLQCVGSGKWSFMIDGDVSAANTRVAADSRWLKCHIRGEFNAGSAKIENAVYMHFGRFERSVTFDNSSIKGNLILTGAHVSGSLLLENAVVGGSLFLVAAKWPKILPCHIGGKLWLLGTVVTGDIDLSGAHIGDDLIMQNATVGENFRARILEGVRPEIEGVTYLNGSRIRGTLEITGATLRKELEAHGVRVEGDFLITYDLDDLNNWTVVRSQIAGLDLESVTIGRSLKLAGITVDPARPDAVCTNTAVNVVGAQISGEFSLYPPNHPKDMLVAKKAGLDSRSITEDEEEAVEKQALAEFAVLEGALNLSRAQISGGVVLDGAKIHGPLDLRDATVKANIDCRPVKIGEGVSRAEAQRADLEALDMTGDVNLTGLNLVGKDGDLILRNARIRGRLELCPFADQNLEAHTPSTLISQIGGDLRLDAAEVSHVILSGLSFGSESPDQSRAKISDFWAWLKPVFVGGTDESERKIRFGLERGRIGRLQIVEPLPGTLDLSNLKVDRWSLPDDQKSYERMLRNSFPFKRSNYLAIENTLRNEGLEERADEINVSMRRRDRQSTKSLWKIWFESFLDVSIKYGTTSKRLAFLMVAMFALSVWVFANPNRVEYSISPAAQKPPPVEHPAPEAWGLRESSLFALRMNVPIVSLGIDEKVRPSGFESKALAIGIIAASWVMWPLLLASLSGLIRRRN